MKEIPLGTVRYSISCWEGTYAVKGKWFFQIRKYRRVIFKRSKREGWRWLGFVSKPTSPEFASRAEALAAARTEKKTLQDRA
jgi:hypothetical protein